MPAVLVALFTRAMHPMALLDRLGLRASAPAPAMAWSLGLKSSVYVLHIFGVAVPCYAALSALALNLTVGIVLSLVFNALSAVRAPTRPRHRITSDFLNSQGRDLTAHRSEQRAQPWHGRLSGRTHARKATAHSTNRSGR